MGKEVCRGSGRKQTLLRCLADRSLPIYELHSAAVPELGADIVQRHDILAELEVIGQLIGASEVGQEVDDVLLLAGEVLCKLVATLLKLLLRSELDNLLALLRGVFSGGLALA